MDFADRRPHESEWLSTSSSNYSLTMILPASCSCNHYSLARFPTVTEICHAMCIRSPPLLSHRSACTAPTAREWLSANKSTTKQTNLTSSQPNLNSHHTAQQPRSRLASLRSNFHPARSDAPTPDLTPLMRTS